MICDALTLAQSAAPKAEALTGWYVAGGIVLLGLVIYGGKDLFRLSLLRIRAVASVCFRESIRRRVLWLVPLAILGVILVSQFQKPLDEQDAVRQVTKFCIFSSAILVTLAAVILACTNLPREIDNRVIYTVVTKPTSRLEILLGKISGFAGLTAVILAIMGLFSWGYVHAFEWRVLQDVQVRVKQGGLEPAAEDTLRYYAKAGLLDARDYASSRAVQVFNTYPKAGELTRQIRGAGEQEAMLPFTFDRSLLPPDSKIAGMLLTLSLPWHQDPLSTDQLSLVSQYAEQAGIHTTVPAAPAGPGIARDVDVSKLFPAFFKISLVNENLETVIDSAVINNDVPQVAADASGVTEAKVPVSGPAVERMFDLKRFYVRFVGVSPATTFTLDPSKVAATILFEKHPPLTLKSAPLGAGDSPILVSGRTTQNGQQLRGADIASAAEGAYEYRNVPASFVRDGEVYFEFRTTVERDSDAEGPKQLTTWMDVRILNKKSGEISPPVKFAVESKRLAHFGVPAKYIAGGNFDVLMRCLSPQQWVSLRPSYLRLASDDRGFALNLTKSLFILWLLTILVITVAVFCSTYVSWPIAFVLTLVILLAHWGVMQLGGLAGAGVGRQIVSDLFAGAAPAVAETLNRSVEGLNSLLRLVSSFLPDVSQFAAMEDIEKGVWISWSRLGAALKVLAMFGLPILTLSYVVFRNKEVAP